MKIQINGFDIEINTNEAEMSVKVLDASGKELANNTYTQTLEGATDTDTEVENPEMKTPDNINADETDIDETTLEDENEAFTFPTFEQFKKKK